MSTPAPRSAFKTDEEYYRAFWVMSELGVDINDHIFFKDFFSNGLCPQTEKEQSHWFDLPERVGEKVALQASNHFQSNHPMNFIVVHVPSIDKYAVAFDINELVNRSDCNGGYLGVCGHHFTY